MDEIVKECITQLAPDVFADPRFDIESRDRGGYFASFVFASEPRFFDELASKRIEIGKLASGYGANVLVYPRTWTP